MSETSSNAVRLSEITKRFGDIVANDSVDFTLRKGTVHALIGENGAGKTTLMNILHGLYTPDEGTVYIDGNSRSFDSPQDAIEAEIGMIHQHFMLVDSMTVLQNIILGHEPSSGGLVDTNAARERIKELCSIYGFDVDQELDTKIEELSVGTQQRVEILKTLFRGASTLILDEPTAVLTPQEVEELFGMMEKLTEQGHSLIFITHKLDEALRAADDISVLRDGEIVATVSANDTTRKDLARMMVGRDVLFEIDSRSVETGKKVLDIDSLRVTDNRDIEQVNLVNFSVKQGEIFGIAGVEGNGQLELIEAIAGLQPVDSGRILFSDENITDMPRRRRIESGIAYIPADRQKRGIVLDYSLRKNALLGNQTIEPFADNGIIDWDEVQGHADKIIDEFSVKPPNANAVSSSLSGGNQQKFIVGRELEHDPDLVIAAFPTRGVDIGSTEFIHNQLLEICQEGKAVLLVSSKLDEVQKLSDRLGVMFEGKIVDIVDPDSVTEEDLGLMMAGRQPTTVKSLDERKQEKANDTSEFKNE
ncbi:ABC transporter ATP-binding protein [Haladaptatus sp. CMAA 1911]|uniref:ABC transporter ATP-binding protein n=1 Tax=unclassified Haladaptatus TaxID=2622732 RepID=UPI003753EE65